MMGRGLYAKLSDAMIAEADEVGHKRQANAVSIGATPGYGLVATDEEALALHIWGARCERAGKVVFPTLTWNAYRDKFDFKGLADLGNLIEVKGMEKDDHRLLVPLGSVNPVRAYLLISRENHPYYWIAGWLWGSEVLLGPVERSFGKFIKRPAYRIPADCLHKPYLLQRIVTEVGF
jgi:hypothetical protein